MTLKITKQGKSFTINKNKYTSFKEIIKGSDIKEVLNLK